jgi:hypothetical protein
MSRSQKSARPVMSVMGRRVIHRSPAKHPEASDPLVAPPSSLSRFDTPDVSRYRPSPERRKELDRQARLQYTEGGPGSGDGGTEGYNAGMKRRTRLANKAKRSWKQSDYGSGGVS